MPVLRNTVCAAEPQGVDRTHGPDIGIDRVPGTAGCPGGVAMGARGRRARYRLGRFGGMEARRDVCGDRREALCQGRLERFLTPLALERREKW